MPLHKFIDIYRWRLFSPTIQDISEVYTAKRWSLSNIHQRLCAWRYRISYLRKAQRDFASDRLAYLCRCLWHFVLIVHFLFTRDGYQGSMFNINVLHYHFCFVISESCFLGGIRLLENGKQHNLPLILKLLDEGLARIFVPRYAKRIKSYSSVVI